jgi:hypothetical protein
METRSFPEIVREHFAFIERHGFACASNSKTKVRYESSKAYIEVSHGEQDGEVAISFGRLTPREEFSFTLFLRKKNPALEKQMGERLTVTPDEVRDCVIKLGDALQREGAEILRGSDAPFEEMKDVRWWHFQPEALKKSSEHRPLQ